MVQYLTFNISDGFLIVSRNHGNQRSLVQKWKLRAQSVATQLWCIIIIIRWIGRSWSPNATYQQTHRECIHFDQSCNPRATILNKWNAKMRNRKRKTWKSCKFWNHLSLKEEQESEGRMFESKFPGRRSTTGRVQARLRLENAGPLPRSNGPSRKRRLRWTSPDSMWGLSHFPIISQ